MNIPKNVRGHFASVWQKNGDSLTATTVTSQRKSKAREKEAARRQAVAAEIENLTGSRPAMIARSIDGVCRRWTGVKGCNAD
jgi:hypothetical protein